MERKRVLLLDMYGVIIKESRGYFIPYTFGKFNKCEHARISKLFWEDGLFTEAGNGRLSSNGFLSLLGYENPVESMQDYLKNYLTFDREFLYFAENNYKQYDFVLLSNDIHEWSMYLLGLYGLFKYFKEIITSGSVHMRKPEKQIFLYVLDYIRCIPEECIYIDNSIRNLDAAQNIGINTILFNRDNEIYKGNVVNNFHELGQLVKEWDRI